MPLSLSAPRHHFSMHLTISVHLLQKQVKQMCGRGLPTPANMPLLPGLSSPYMPKKPGGPPAQTSQVKRLSSPWKDASVSVSTYSVHLLQQRLLGILPRRIKEQLPKNTWRGQAWILRSYMQKCRRTSTTWMYRSSLCTTSAWSPIFALGPSCSRGIPLGI